MKFHFLRPAFPPLIFGLVLGFSASAQIPAPTDAPKPRTPEQSAAAFKLPPGFRMEVVASEPLIASPSGICWDERGRMFVSELHGYNLAGQLDIEELNKTGKLDTQVRRVQADAKHKHAAERGTFGVIKLLADTNGDGRMDKATAFLDNVVMPRAVMAVNGGALIAVPPQLLFCKDTDGDGVADVKDIVATDFGTLGGQPEHMANSPVWAMDNSIWSAGYSSRTARMTACSSVFNLRPGLASTPPMISCAPDKATANEASRTRTAHARHRHPRRRGNALRCRPDP